MKKFLYAFCLVVSCFGLSLPARPDAPSAALSPEQEHLVFAHYMPCFPAAGFSGNTYWWAAQYNPALSRGGLTARPVILAEGPGDEELNATIADIQLAKSYGIDGFLVDELDDDENYCRTWLRLLKAAEIAGNFKIGVMPDYATLPGSDPKNPGRIPVREKILHWLTLAQNSPALLRIDGKPVVMPYGVGFPDGAHSQFNGSLNAAAGEKKYIVDWLASQGMPIVYGATHGVNSPLYEHPFAHDPQTGFQTFAFATGSFTPVVEEKYYERALSYWPPSMMQMGENAFIYYNRGWLYLSGGDLTAYYRHHWEWNIAHRDRVRWIMLVTWNDWGETALAPSSNHYMAWQPLTRYYAGWFKTGHKPKIVTDVVTLFHRPHPYAAVPTVDTFEVGKAANFQITPPADVVEAVALLKAPATLTLITGGHISRKAVGAGVQSLVIPFALGVQSARIERRGKIVASITTPIPVTDKPARQNLWYVGADSAHPPRPFWAETGPRSVSGLSLLGQKLCGDISVTSRVAVLADASRAGLGAHLSHDGGSGYFLLLCRDNGAALWRLEKRDRGTITLLDSGPATPGPHVLRLDCVGEYRIVYLDGKLAGEVSDYPSYPDTWYLSFGQSGIFAEGSLARFANMKVFSYDPSTADVASSK